MNTHKICVNFSFHKYVSTQIYKVQLLCHQSLDYTDCILCSEVRTPTLQKNECYGYDTKLHLVVRLKLWRVWSTLSF